VSSVAELIEACADAMTAAGVVFGHGTDNAWDEATVLVLSVADLADDQANLAVVLAPEKVLEIEALLRRRIEERQPLAYLLGRWWFAGHEFLLRSGVVVPRSPIGELLAGGMRPWLTEPPRRILDLCTGSGCIGISAALAWTDAEVDLVELDGVAAELARENVHRHGLEDRVRVHHGSLYEPLPSGMRYDLILSNPPYVDAADMSTLPAEFRQEPALGLAGGEDGLDLVRDIIDQRGDWLTEEGVLVCEVGMSAAALARAYPDLPFIWPEFEQGGEGVFVLLPDAAAI
jgi:ribosomal protein L3 glutamine methyltransferase